MLFFEFYVDAEITISSNKINIYVNRYIYCSNGNINVMYIYFNKFTK